MSWVFRSPKPTGGIGFATRRGNVVTCRFSVYGLEDGATLKKEERRMKRKYLVIAMLAALGLLTPCAVQGG